MIAFSSEPRIAIMVCDAKGMQASRVVFNIICIKYDILSIHYIDYIIFIVLYV